MIETLSSVGSKFLPYASDGVNGLVICGHSAEVEVLMREVHDFFVSEGVPVSVQRTKRRIGAGESILNFTVFGRTPCYQEQDAYRQSVYQYSMIYDRVGLVGRAKDFMFSRLRSRGGVDPTYYLDEKEAWRRSS